MDSSAEHSAAAVSGFGEEAGLEPVSEGVRHLEPGQTIELGGDPARYELVRLLGRGGMAEVFLARKLGPSGFVREVALKCMVPGLELDERARRAFLYEARLASKLRHPNIAEAYDLAELGDRYYLVLEYIEGVTCRSVIRAARRGRLTEGFSCHVAAGVADALHYAHSLTDADGERLGIVHRDVSAANVMISKSGVVKLVDFGIAKARMQGRDETRTGAHKGTFAYSSPEQVLEEELDGRSDLFSLGVLLVELLTGRRVFEAETLAGTIAKKSECRSAEVRAVTRGLPRRLARICEKALSRRPVDRFQDGLELSSALRSYLASGRTAYSPGDCAAELAELGVGQAGVPEPATDDAEDVWEPTGSPRFAQERGKNETRPGRAVVPRVLVMAGVLAAAVLPLSSEVNGPAGPLEARVPVRKSSSPLSVVASSERATGEEPHPQGEAKPVEGPRSSVSRATAFEGPVVRPKRAAGVSRARQPASAEEQPREPSPERVDRTQGRIARAEFVDRPSVDSASATLARGTLVPAMLLRPIVAEFPGQAEAVVTDDVLGDGKLLVPKGSTVVCTSRRRDEGRVPLTCDTIRTLDRQLSFQGVAVGEGQHVGLRALDSEIAAGTAFVVYVNASAALK